VTELQQAVQFEAKNIFPFETEKAHIVPPATSAAADVRQEVIVIAAHDDVTSYVERPSRAPRSNRRSGIVRCTARWNGLSAARKTSRRACGRHGARPQGDHRQGRDITFIKSIEVVAGHFNDAVSKSSALRLRKARFVG
jgi:hypothetical protein